MPQRWLYITQHASQGLLRCLGTYYDTSDQECFLIQSSLFLTGIVSPILSLNLSGFHSALLSKTYSKEERKQKTVLLLSFEYRDKCVESVAL